MKLYLIFILLSSASISYAKKEILLFKTDGFYYELETSPRDLKIKGYLINLSFDKKDCNEYLIQSFNKMLTDAFKSIITAEDNFHSVELNNKKYKIAKDSKLGMTLYNLPKIIKSDKLKESFLCRKSKKLK